MFVLNNFIIINAIWMGSSITLFHYHSTFSSSSYFLLYFFNLFSFCLAKQLFDYKCTSPSYYTIHNRFRLHRRLLFISIWMPLMPMFGKQQNKTTLMVQQLNASSEKHSNYNTHNNMTKRLNEPNHFHDIWSINIMNGMVAATFNNIIFLMYGLCLCVCVLQQV